MTDAPKILGTDTLRQAYPKLNSAIGNSNEALKTANNANSKSENAINTANAAETKANSVQEQFNQVVIDGDSSVEAAQARVKEDGTSFPTLQGRLNDTDAKVAQKANDSEVRKKSVKLELEDMSETTLGAMSGNATFNLLSVPQDNSVTPEKTTFVSKGKNIWDGKVKNGYYISFPSADVAGTYSPLAGAVSIVQKVEKGSTVTVSKKVGTSDRFIVAANVGYPQEGQATLRFISSNNTITGVTATLQGNEDHLVIYLSTQTQGTMPQEFQIEYGSSQSPYEPHTKVKVDFSSVQDFQLKKGQVQSNHVADKTIRPNHVTFLGRGKNLFNGVFTKDVSLIGSTATDGQLYSLGRQELSVIVEIEPGKTYTVSKLAGSSNRFRAATFTIYPKVGDKVKRFLNGSDSISQFTFTANEGDNYLVVYLALDGYVEPLEFMVEEGSAKTAYESPDKVTIEFSSKQTFGNSGKEIYLTNIITSNYDSAVPYTAPLQSTNVQDLYAIYDNLVTAYPHYVTKTLLGNDAVNGLPIYRYDFKPSAESEYPKFIYNLGAHGMEKHAMWGGAKFFEDLCLNWKTDDFLEALRWNVHLIVIPCLNPSGYNLNQRKNANGVDLNRNFTHGWGTSGDTDPTSVYYRGPSAGSEVETRLLEQLLAENNDALFVVDHHNSGGWESQGFVVWTAANEDAIKKMLDGYNHFIEGKTKKDFSYIDESVSLQFLDNNQGGSVAYHAYKEGIKSALLESAVQFSTDQDTQKHNVDVAANFVLAVLKNYS
jgi:hypothetical protein